MQEARLSLQDYAGSSPDARLRRWNAATARPLEPQARIERWVSRQALASPDSVAVFTQGTVLTYAALDAQANRFAHVLKARGIGLGSRVGICLSRGPALVPAMLGTLKAGAAFVPLDPGFAKDRLHFMAQDAGVHLVITETAHAALSGVAAGQQLRVDEHAGLIAAAPAGPIAMPAHGSDDAAACIVYTSGTNGQPKGVVLMQRALCNVLASVRLETGLAAADRLLAVTAWSVGTALLELLLPLTVGARVVVARREDAVDADALVHLLAEQRISAMQAMPATWQLLIDAQWNPPAGFKALCGGEPLPPSLAARLLERGVELWNLYGATETTVWSTLSRIQDAEQPISIGHPVANTHAWVLDEQQHPCAVGEEGELCIGGAGVARGYLNRPEPTAEKFIPDPFDPGPGALLYRRATGSAGGPTAPSSTWGDRIGWSRSAAFVSNWARSRPGSPSSRAWPEPSFWRVRTTRARYGWPPLCWCKADSCRTPHSCAMPCAATCPTTCCRKTWSCSTPCRFCPMARSTVTRWPRVPGLPPYPWSRRLQRLPVRQGRAMGDTAALIARTMAQVLKLSAMGPDDSFFELGGHSLQAAALSARLGQVLGRRPGVRAIFEAPTPALLAHWWVAQQRPAAGEAAAIPHRAEQSIAPLSLMQQRMWFLENALPGTNVNAIPSAHRFKGDLDVAALERAFRALVERQPSLRTVIERTDSGARQRIRDRIDVTLQPVEDLSALADAERAAEFQRQVQEHASVRFDLERGPLFRVKLWRLGPLEHGLLFVPHHLIWDGESFDLLFAELAELYEAECQARAHRLPPLTVTYADFSHWQRDALRGPELERQVAHWVRQLSPLPPSLDLPGARSRPLRMSGQAGSHAMRLSAGESDALSAMASQRATTPYVLLLCAYTLLLHRMTGQRDFAVGTPVRGREQAGLERVMGFFVNMLPLRSTFDPALTMTEWLARNHRLVVDAFAHPDVPFEHLVRRLNPPRDYSRSPIHQTSFSYQDLRENSARFGNLEHDSLPSPPGGASQDLALWCVMTGAGLDFEFAYNADILSQADVALLALRLRAVLQAMVRSPEMRLADIDILAPAERRSLATWNDTDADLGLAARPAATLCVHELIVAQALRTPHAVALYRAGHAALSYEALDRRSNRLARWLRQRGICRGVLVGLCLERGLDMVVAQLAVLKAGAGYVPLDPAYPKSRLYSMAEDASLALLITDRASRPSIDWPQDLSLCLDESAGLLDIHDDTPLRAAPSIDAAPDDVAYVIYTSGSTGQPKGVSVPHRAVVNFLLSMAREPGLDADDILLAVTTLSFDIAVLELLLPLSVGAQVVVAERRDVQDGKLLLALLQDSGATTLQATPGTWRMLLEAGWPGGRGFKALIGGEPLPVDLADALLRRGVELWNMFGPTETTVWSTCWKVEHPERGIFVGRPIANTQVHVLDDAGLLCPVGVAGELCIGGAGVALGYLYRPEMTAERFIDDPFARAPVQDHPARLYRTGDRGRWCANGLLEHLGRMDNQVKVRGFRIELGEIEATLARHETVAQCVVALREDRPGDQRLVAYVVPRGPMPAFAELRAHLRGSLPEHMLPHHIVEISSVPLLPNGKTDRSALPAPAGQGQARPSPSPIARTPTQQHVWEVWRDLLGVDTFSVDDNFFDLGGHSLLAMTLVSRLEARFSRKLGLNSVLEAPTVAQFADLIDGQVVPFDSLLPLRAGGSAAPIFFVHDASGETLVYRSLALRMPEGVPVHSLRPLGAEGISMVHTRVEDMAAHYVARIRALQPQGPYRLGGLCAGGVIAFEMALQLQRVGQSVSLLALIEAPDVAARARTGRYALGRLQPFLKEVADQSPLVHPKAAFAAVLELLGQMSALLVHQVRTRVEWWWASRQVLKLRESLEKGEALPEHLRNLSPEWIHGLAQSEYRNNELYRGDVLLFRATRGNGDFGDTPHIDLYADPLFGWKRSVLGAIHCVDVPGGHFSMLQEPHVAAIARGIEAHLGPA
jgi:amino acid adenylation domain-containing protein